MQIPPSSQIIKIHLFIKRKIYRKKCVNSSAFVHKSYDFITIHIEKFRNSRHNLLVRRRFGSRLTPLACSFFSCRLKFKNKFELRLMNAEGIVTNHVDYRIAQTIPRHIGTRAMASRRRDDRVSCKPLIVGNVRFRNVDRPSRLGSGRC